MFSVLSGGDFVFFQQVILSGVGEITRAERVRASKASRRDASGERGDLDGDVQDRYDDL